jgi:signal transduction histidine kinase
MGAVATIEDSEPAGRPPRPFRELERLEALRSYELMDTPPEDVYDDLTALAAQICGTPISLVTLIDAERQFYKSRVGVEGTETSRDISFCAHAINDDALFVVPDATRDPRFADNPDVIGGLGIRFYAGAPLVNPDGLAIGTLCVVDRVPRGLTPAQERSLRALSRAVMAQIELRRQNARLRDLDRLKDDFVALISHELRTPLTSIRGYLELLQAGDAGALNDTQQRFLGVADRNAGRLERLVGDLLFIARVDAGEVQIDAAPTDIAALAEEAVEAARPAADAKDIALSVSAGDVPALVGDPGRLAQMLDNLVSNAIKFTPAGGRVDLRVHADEGTVTVEVQDTGNGIPASEIPLLFSRFYRAKSALDEGIPGTGLGLGIAKAIAEGHGGLIAVESTVGAGTRFTVTLPRHGVI